MKNIPSVQTEINKFLYKFGALPSPIVNLIDNLNKDFEKTDKRIKEGVVAPDFTLPDENNDFITLSKVLENGPVILSFFRGDWCPICDIELRNLQRYIVDFQKYGATLLAISPQKIYYSKITRDKNSLQYSVLSDMGNYIARLYGINFELPPDMITLYQMMQIDIPRFNGGEKWELVIPATYVISHKNKKVIFSFTNPDYTKRSEPADILASLIKL